MNVIPPIFIAIPQMNAHVNNFWGCFIQPLRYWKLESAAHHCELEVASGYAGNWILHLRTAVMNSLADQLKVHVQGHYIIEWVREDFCTYFKSCHPEVPTRENQTDVLTAYAVEGAEEQSSRLLFMTSDRAVLDCHNSLINTRSNATTSGAPKNNEEKVDLVGDSIAGSNSAIIAFSACGERATGCLSGRFEHVWYDCVLDCDECVASNWFFGEVGRADIGG